jgi:hypothetical protein
MDGIHTPTVKPRTVPSTSSAHAAPLQRYRTVALRQPTVPNPRPDLPRQSRSKVLKRQAVGRKGTKLHRPSYRLAIWPAVISAAILLLSTGLAFAGWQVVRKSRGQQVDVKAASTSSPNTANAMTSDIPTEGTPPNLTEYQVGPDMPRYFKIGKLGVNARILPMDAGPNGIIAAPATIYDVGWYSNSAKPGSGGTILMDGHVSGSDKRGVFYDIKSLQNGDKINVERGDGKQFTYIVTKTETFDFDKVDMHKLSFSVQPGKPGLNIVTSTGRFNVRTNSYEQRVAVFAVQE